MTTFTEWFVEITNGKQPFPYQKRFAEEPELPTLLNVITGAGKTATVVLGWLWRRRLHPDLSVRQTTPRRLVICLPMRTLVEQTYAEVDKWLKKDELIGEVELHLLMGGAVSQSWDICPEKDCILIGTQDQLLSRALNRGYGMSRYRWPIHFALLNNDCLWVMDEVQLMGAGLKTTAQLQGFREEFQTYGCAKSLWMSATLDPESLLTVNYRPDLSKFHTLTESDKSHPLLKERIEAKKELVKAKTTLDSDGKGYAKALAQEVIEAHTPDTLTIVICNRVSRAQEVYQELQSQGVPEKERFLIHARFRLQERQKLNKELHTFQSGILVATQAIEAGVDISALTLFTEIAPWSSIVQRVGRCNRYGEHSNNAKVYWIDIDLNQKKHISPYEKGDLVEAQELLSPLKDVGPETLSQVQSKPSDFEELIPRKHDLIQLFDTSTDLAGHDIDVSPFIRQTDDTDIAIAWRDWSGECPNIAKGALLRKELCRVSIGQAKAFLENLRKKNSNTWIWDSLQGEWKKSINIYPGMLLLVHCSNGGYSETLGFTGDFKDIPKDIADEVIKLDSNDEDHLTDTIGKYISLIVHSNDVADEVTELCKNFIEYGLNINLLERTGRWHDLGKAHEVFQKVLTQDDPDIVKGGPWAKSAQKSSIKSERPGFRHELVSALLALQEKEPFLLTYLVAAHHGKIRLTIQPLPKENKPSESNRKYARGVWDRDPFPEIDLGDGLTVKAQNLSLACMEMGEREHGESWTSQAINLLDEYGPFKLAFLETIIRIADWRASAKYNPDILHSN
ncbi:CRISPR-associated helicase Cas3' [Nostoc flagelliforme FACHB-838]|uniref:CRISPR-associated helicase Cas3 n=1 Tax=Nostoc flagelliforme FACHB-838 TaxID=2692904 RepID=A0ABR8E4F8_9NOSO|nr:CRISPR-associated helicase Cas3' [Nostoc flagelliforme]MBD2536195.1 CRISPR-associated helicase Cas3' [Nostoc flagelliforme FACHB-838]